MFARSLERVSDRSLVSSSRVVAIDAWHTGHDGAVRAGERLADALLRMIVVVALGVGHRHPESSRPDERR